MRGEVLLEVGERSSGASPLCEQKASCVCVLLVTMVAWIGFHIELGKMWGKQQIVNYGAI